MPLARSLHRPTVGFLARTGIGFVGGFAHRPNVDAISFFLTDVWPRIRQASTEQEFSIVGADLPPELRASLPPGVRYLGHLPDLQPWFDSLRVTVAPLRFGAGAKGKIASSIAHGVPCVATPIAVEGMHLRDGIEVVIGDTAESLAAGVLRVHDDETTWQIISTGGLEFAERELSPAAWQRAFHDILRAVGLASSPQSLPPPSEEP
jgi:glycosyltransferase involved in cell wall biosynthesis